MKWLAGRPWLLALLIVTVLGVPGYIAFQIQDSKQDHLIDCLTTWSEDFTGRSSNLSAATEKLATAEDVLLRSAATGDRQAIIDNLQKYVTASDEYKLKLQENPVPEAPRLRCD